MHRARYCESKAEDMNVQNQPPFPTQTERQLYLLPFYNTVNLCDAYHEHPYSKCYIWSLIIFWWACTSDTDGSTCEIYGLDTETLNNSYKIGEEMSFLFHSLAKVLELFQCCLPWKSILVTLRILLFDNCNIMCSIDWHIM